MFRQHLFSKSLKGFVLFLSSVHVSRLKLQLKYTCWYCLLHIYKAIFLAFALSSIPATSDKRIARRYSDAVVYLRVSYLHMASMYQH